MKPILCAFIAFLTILLRSRLSLQIEIVALRHQLAVYGRSARRPRIHPGDRILWCWIARLWCSWRDALMFVRPATVTAWQRKRFRDHWSKLSQRGKPGRPSVAEEVKALIRRISRGLARSDSAVGFEVRPRIWPASASKTRSLRRHVASGRGIHQDQRQARLPVACC